ncbi:MAG: acylneuraminate cytidylyltransferase family protein [Thermodesulfobacteriota bacterium]|nr:acylneuraminate cytidylyltransferase family protein [Thermodesulfobacteriota bacterium]
MTKINKNCKIVGIIPARSGSKNIPLKNIRDLAGKPLIAYTIESALNSKLLNRVIVSTDDEKIAAISRTFGAEIPFIRPAELAQDTTPTLPVLQHAVQFLCETERYQPDIIVTLQPTSPLRKANQIDEAIKKLFETGSDSVVSLSETEHSPYWMQKVEGDRVFPFIEGSEKYTRRQDLPKIYQLNGAVYVTKYDILMKENKILGNDTRAFIMNKQDSIDIDTELDWKFAELILEG